MSAPTKICESTGKCIYRTRTKAIRGLAEIRAQRARGLTHRGEVAVYRCHRCGFWHLTSWEPRPKEAA